MAAPELRVLIVEDQEEARLLSAALLYPSISLRAVRP